MSLRSNASTTPIDAQKAQQAKQLYWIERLKSHYIAKKLPPDRTMTLANLLGQLEMVSESGDGWSACCPNHADTRPSLSAQSLNRRQPGREFFALLPPRLQL